MTSEEIHEKAKILFERAKNTNRLLSENDAKIIAQDSKYSYWYAREILHMPWEESDYSDEIKIKAVENMAKYHAYNYAHLVLNDKPWYKTNHSQKIKRMAIEGLTNTCNSYFVREYIKSVIKKPLEEWDEWDYRLKKRVIKAIIKDTWECYRYAYNIIKKPWEKNDYWDKEIINMAIESIKRDNFAFFLYKADVCNTDYIELLDIAIKNVDYIVKQESGFESLQELITDHDIPKDEDGKAKYCKLKDILFDMMVK